MFIFSIFLYNEKKFSGKKIMGNGWGLWHKKVTMVYKHLNHQAPQANHHTFFYIKLICYI